VVHIRYCSDRLYQHSPRPLRKEFWQYESIGGLPEHFAEAEDLVLALPKWGRCRAAHGLYECRDKIGASTACAGTVTAWDLDHRDVIEPFGSARLFATARRTTAPPRRRSSHACAEISRGVLLHEFKLVALAILISWTRSRAIACWLALRDYVSSLQFYLLSVILRASITPSTIVAWHDRRAEQKVIIDPIDLGRTAGISVDGLGPSAVQRPLADLKIGDHTYCELIAMWRYTSARYQRWRDLIESRRNCTPHVIGRARLRNLGRRGRRSRA
jgi:hypothetical protein